MRTILTTLALLAMLNCPLFAQEEHPAPAGESATVAHLPGEDTAPHPVIAANTWWAGLVVILILSLFVFAAGVGGVIRATMPEDETPPDHAHDDHGAHGHGHDDAHGHDSHGGDAHAHGGH